MYAVELPAIAVSLCSSISSNKIVNVPAVDVPFATTMFVTTAVVEDGTVYSVVLDVAAAPLKRAFVNVAVSYYLRVLVVLLLL